MKVFRNARAQKRTLETYDMLLGMWNTSYSEVDVKTSFGTTHCVITGNEQSPPLLLFHGVGDNSAVMWMLNIEELSKHFHCIAVDTLGGPGKSIPNENYTRHSFHQRTWINEVADHFNLNCFNIAGVSNGAVIAYHYAAVEGARVTKAVCMEGGLIIRPFQAMLRTIGLLFPYILLPTKQNMAKILRKMCAPNSALFEKHPEIADYSIALMLCHRQGAMFMHKLKKYTEMDQTGLKEKLYFLLGEYNLGRSGEFVDVLRTLNFNYKIICDAGHAMNHEQAQEVNREIIRFLS